jgi:DNA (cytosine-5)-methyltransferase 1
MCVQVIKNHGDLVDEKRIFKSDVKDENPLDCLVKKVNIVQISPDVSALCCSLVM